MTQSEFDGYTKEIDKIYEKAANYEWDDEDRDYMVYCLFRDMEEQREYFDIASGEKMPESTVTTVAA